MNNYEILINKKNMISEDFCENYELIDVLNIENENIKIEKLTTEFEEQLKTNININPQLNELKRTVNKYNKFKNKVREENLLLLKTYLILTVA